MHLLHRLCNACAQVLTVLRVLVGALSPIPRMNDEELNTEELNIGTEVTGPYNLKSCQGEDYKFHFL